jgi:hypothetical protein
VEVAAAAGITCRRRRIKSEDPVKDKITVLVAKPPKLEPPKEPKKEPDPIAMWPGDGDLRQAHG